MFLMLTTPLLPMTNATNSRSIQMTASIGWEDTVERVVILDGGNEWSGTFIRTVDNWVAISQSSAAMDSPYHTYVDYALNNSLIAYDPGTGTPANWSLINTNVVANNYFSDMCVMHMVDPTDDVSPNFSNSWCFNADNGIDRGELSISTANETFPEVAIDIVGLSSSSEYQIGWELRNCDTSTPTSSGLFTFQYLSQYQKDFSFSYQLSGNWYFFYDLSEVSQSGGTTYISDHSTSCTGLPPSGGTSTPSPTILSSTVSQPDSVTGLISANTNVKNLSGGVAYTWTTKITPFSNNQCALDNVLRTSASSATMNVNHELDDIFSISDSIGANSSGLYSSPEGTYNNPIELHFGSNYCYIFTISENNDGNTNEVNNTLTFSPFQGFTGCSVEDICWNPNTFGYGSSFSPDGTWVTYDYEAMGETIAAQPIPSEGKWYWEYEILRNSGSTGNWAIVGVHTGEALNSGYVGIGSNDNYGWGFDSNGFVYHSNSWKNVGCLGEIECWDTETTVTIGIAIDMDSGTMWYSKNGVWPEDISNGATPIFGTSTYADSPTAQWDVNFGSSGLEPDSLGGTQLYPAISVTGNSTSHSINLRTGDTVEHEPPSGFEVLGESEPPEIETDLFWGNEDVNGDDIADELVLHFDLQFPEGEDAEGNVLANPYSDNSHTILWSLKIFDDGSEIYSNNEDWGDYNFTNISGITKWFEAVSGFPPGWHEYCASVTIQDDVTGQAVGNGDICLNLNKDEPGLGDDCSGISSSDYLIVTESTVDGGTLNGRYERGFGWAAEPEPSTSIGTHEGPDALYWYQTQDGGGNTFEEWAFYQRTDDLWSAMQNTNPPQELDASAILYTSNWGVDSCHPVGTNDANNYGTIIHYTGGEPNLGNNVRADIDWNPEENELTLDLHAHAEETVTLVKIVYVLESFDSEYDWSYDDDTGTLSLDENRFVTYSTIISLEGVEIEHTFCVSLLLINDFTGAVLSDGIGCMYIGDEDHVHSASVNWNADISTGSTSASSGFEGSWGDKTVDDDLETAWISEFSCDPSSSPEFLRINLANYQDVAGVSVYWGDEVKQPLNYEILALDTMDNWVPVFEIDLESDEWYGTIHHVIPTIHTNAIKIKCIDSDGEQIQINELEIHPSYGFEWNPSDNLVGYWDFDEPVDVNAFSDALNNNDGLIYGPAELGHPARFGNGLELHGYSDTGAYTATAFSPLSSETESFTLSMWAKFDVINLPDGLFGFGFQPDNSDTAFHLAIVEEGNNEHFQVVQNGTPYLDHPLDDGFNLNEWQHYVLKAFSSESSGRTYELELYINGEFQDTGYLPKQMGDNWNLYFGSISSDAGYVMDGMIDEVRIYDIALDSEIIDSLYTNAANFANGGNNNGGNNDDFDGINFENDLTDWANAFASSERPNHPAIDAIDDLSETSWGPDEYCPQDIMIDLGDEYNVAAVKIVWYLPTFQTIQYEIETWTSESGWSMQIGHTATTNQELMPVMHLMYPHDAQKILVKCVNYGSPGFEIIEIEVFEPEGNWYNLDFDNDLVTNGADACFDGDSNWGSDPITDHDNDGCQDSTEDSDDDNDGINDEDDNCETGQFNWDSWNDGDDYDHDGCHDSTEDDDDDEDGINDASDSCLQTRLGAGVNSLGCEISFADVDGDGVADSYDTCPNTQAGTEVDMFNGCPLYSDVDGDGVNDNEDAFPDDPTEQFDTDQDGIGDNADLCDDSLPGDLVDLTGCLVDDQTDNNETSNMTACEDWEYWHPDEVNASLPGNGCPSYTFEDTDGDGVNDLNPDGSELDKCPETEIDQTVDEYGCATSMLPPALASALDFILNIDSLLGLPDGTLEILFTVVGILFGVLRFAGKRTLAGKTRRVEKYSSEIRMARTRRELENLERRITKDNNKGLLPPGGFGDLMELIEMRAIELGEMDMATQVRETVVEAESRKEEHDQMLEEMAGTREAVAGLQEELSEMRRKGPPGKGRRGKGPPKRRGMDESGFKIQESGGPRRPSLHPADLDGDGFVTDEERKIWRERQEKEDKLWEYD
jgi:hypothetical protein